jgi:hypothetical protein
MPTKTNKPKTSQPALSKRSDNYRVRIRMYRQGLGDCFLLSFPKAVGKPVHVMIDCGVVLGTSEPNVVMKQVAENVKLATGGKVDLLVITHEHWDHLSGFDQNQARAVFKDIRVEALWLAWTEDDRNPLANRLREERERKKEAAEAARKAVKERGLTEQAARMAELLGFFGAKAAGDSDEGEDGGGTAGALAFLKSHCAPTILETGGRPCSIPGVDGVRVYVMGPPMDGGAMTKTNPYKGEGYGLGGDTIGLAEAFLAAFDPNDERAHPFAPTVRKPMAELPTRLAAAKAQAASPSSAPPAKVGIDWYVDAANEWRNIDNAWLGMGERLALQLDNATNNTSLVLAFEFEGSNDVLLFVGDAQAGNWRSWDSCAWTVKEKDGEYRKVTAADLLQRTVFYKVGHHGSHNATLREKGLERMTSRNLAAVIPVDTEVAHKVKGWEDMPLPAIRTRLEEKCAVVFQSDMPPLKLREVPKARWEESTEKFDVRMKDKATKKVKTVRKQSLYTDYFL